MPIRQLKIRKRVIKREEQIAMHESAKAYLTADDEDSYVVAPASTVLDENNRFAEEFIIVRTRSEYPQIMRQDSSKGHYLVYVSHIYNLIL